MLALDEPADDHIEDRGQHQSEEGAPKYATEYRGAQGLAHLSSSIFRDEERCPPVLAKDEDYHENEGKGFEERMGDRIDRFLYEHRRVVDNTVFQPGRKVFADFGHGLADAVGRGHEGYSSWSCRLAMIALTSMIASPSRCAVLCGSV